MKSLILRIICGCLLLCPLVAHAFSVEDVSVPSTPFTPPGGFLWVTLLFVLLFCLLNGLLLRWAWSTSWRTALIASAIGGACIALFCTYFSVQTYRMQIQGLVWGSPVFWGRDWQVSKHLFLTMNGLTLLPVIGGVLCMACYHYSARTGKDSITLLKNLGAVIVGCAILAAFTLNQNGENVLIAGGLVLLLAVGGLIQAIRQIGGRVIVLIGANLLCYLVCLTPYLMSGAYTHGLAPWSQCSWRVGWGIGGSMLAYTRAHHGQLPTGQTITALIEQLKPYSEAMPEWAAGQTPVACAAGPWLERHPQPYQWNKSFAGKTIDDLRKLPKPVALVTCPYHHYRYFTTADLVKAYDDPHEVFINTSHY